jgi:hypothetical protein
LLAPVFSPSGCYLAVAGSNLPDQSQLHIFDPSTAELQAGPPAKGAHQQLWPHWVDDRTLVYLAHEDDGSFLCRWTRGSGVPPERLCQVNTSSSALGSSQVFAGLAGPLSPGGRRLAYYDPAADALTLIDLADGRKHTLKTRTQAGCWMGSRRFAAATDKELFVASPDTSEQAEVMRGPWLPRWANPEANQLVLCTRSPEPWTFELVRLQLNP